jgi:Tol biopolymer transport system component
VVPAAGGAPTWLATGTWPSWTPDGAWVVFKGQPGIYRVRRSGGPADLLRAGGTNPQVSADGATLFVSTSDDDAAVVWAHSLAGGLERRLLDLRGRPGRLRGFITDGRNLYFTWSETFADIWAMDVEEARR